MSSFTNRFIRNNIVAFIQSSDRSCPLCPCASYFNCMHLSGISRSCSCNHNRDIFRRVVPVDRYRYTVCSRKLGIERDFCRLVLNDLYILAGIPNKHSGIRSAGHSHCCRLFTSWNTGYSAAPVIIAVQGCIPACHIDPDLYILNSFRCSIVCPVDTDIQVSGVFILLLHISTMEIYGILLFFNLDSCRTLFINLRKVSVFSGCCGRYLVFTPNDQALNGAIPDKTVFIGYCDRPRASVCRIQNMN